MGFCDKSSLEDSFPWDVLQAQWTDVNSFSSVHRKQANSSADTLILAVVLHPHLPTR